MSRAFFDSNVLLYTISKADHRRFRASELLIAGGVISVQCLNEFASVARRKLKLSWDAVADARVRFLVLCDPVLPMTVDLHEQGLLLSRRYQLSIYDGLIVAAALHAGCDTLWSEDMQDGLLVEGRLRLSDPFRSH